MAKIRTFSLLSVSWKNPDGTVSGYWIQDHIGTIHTATQRARETESANSNKINIAVVECVNSPVAILEFWENQRLAS